jgi:hypothetical protein
MCNERPKHSQDLRPESEAPSERLFGSGADAHDFLFSGTMAALCYWASICLLAIAGAYLIRWQFTHVDLNFASPDDPFGVRTPPWLVLMAAPVGVGLSLIHAISRALRGTRHWRMVLSAASLITLLACGRLLNAWPW